MDFQQSGEKEIWNIRVTEIEVDKYKSQNHPALGEKNSTTTLYYYVGSHEVNDGADQLFKIEHVENYAANQEYQEYYFSPDNELVFYYEKMPVGEELRLYFNKEQLIEFRYNEEKYKEDELTKTHFEEAKLVLNASKKRCLQ